MSTSVNLVLEGGGVKGIGLVGAISVLEEAGYVFDRVAGTSAGAIVGSLVAAGMTSAALHDLMVSLNYEDFRDETHLDHFPVVGRGLALWLEHGIYAGDFVHTWIGQQLARLGVTTFKDLAYADPGNALPPNERYKLVVMTSDVSRGQLLQLPWDYPSDGLAADDQRVADAVRASMSIPFFYRPFELAIPHGHPSFCVDGGMLANFPIAVFDPTDGSPPARPTIGIRLSARTAPDVVQHQVKGDLSLGLAMLGTMQSWYDQMHEADPAVIAKTIFVDTFKINATDFSIDRPTQERLYQSGRAAAQQFLAQPAPAS
jgi:NTE family protein